MYVSGWEEAVHESATVRHHPALAMWVAPRWMPTQVSGFQPRRVRGIDLDRGRDGRGSDEHGGWFPEDTAGQCSNGIEPCCWHRT